MTLTSHAMMLVDLGQGGGSSGGGGRGTSSLPDEQRIKKSDKRIAQPLLSTAGINEINDADERVSGETKAKIVDTLSEAAGVKPEKVQLILDTWAESSNDSKANSLSVQTTAAKVFDSPLSEWQQSKIEAVGESKVKYSENAAKVLQASYELTQQTFRDAGLSPDDTVTLYRGTKSIKEDGVVDYKGNAIESWSVSPKVAYDFAGNRGAVLAANIRVADIVSSCATGIGCLYEGEVIVKGMSNGSTVRSYGVGSSEEYQFGEDRAKREKFVVIIDSEAEDDWIKAIQPANETELAKRSMSKK